MTIQSSSPLTKKPVSHQPVGASPIKPLPDTAFFKNVQGILQEGIQNGYSREYVADQIYKLAQENPETAQRITYPMEAGTIKKEIVDSFYDRRHEGKRDSRNFNLKDTGECLAGQATNIALSSYACASSITKKSPLSAVATCGQAVTAIVECVKNGFEGDGK